LDHVTIAGRDLKAAKRVYSDLGFSIVNGGRHPIGTENSMVDFGDAGGYLKLITPYDARSGRESLLPSRPRERGSILRLRASDASGPTARRLKERGEGGQTVGVSLA
jgi:catechol 2,3-dioxygenase-like lactoylglutathione lyase family enzyme